MIVNYAGTPVQCKLCKDIIQSQHRHDMVWCRCGAISIDGGSSYTRVSWDGSRGDYGDLFDFEYEDPS